jgi:hypothetical protein
VFDDSGGRFSTVQCLEMRRGDWVVTRETSVFPCIFSRIAPIVTAWVGRLPRIEPLGFFRTGGGSSCALRSRWRSLSSSR